LSDEEAQALARFAGERVANLGLTEADHFQCRQIRIVLQERAARLGQPEKASAFQRTNLTLRAAIDLFLARDYASVLNRDVTMLRDTKSKLEAMVATGDSSPNHVRLSTLIGECLAAYAAWQSQSPAATETPPLSAPSAPDGSAPNAASVDPRALLASAGAREAIEELERIPLTTNVRTLIHEGDLDLPCELSDEYLIDVRGGALVVRGGLFGVVVADGDITVHGSVQGGWLYSRNGSIRAERILAGSVLIAPEGGISTGAVESPKLVYCGLDFASDQGLRGGVYFVRNCTVAEGVRNARIHLRGNLHARTIEADGQDDSAAIHFRLAQTCQDFGRPLPDTITTPIRNLGRLWYRRRATAALYAYLESDLLAMQRFRLFALQVGVVDPSVFVPIREAQAEHAILSFLLELGEGLKELMALGENMGKSGGALIAAGVEESVAALAIATKEIKALGKGYIRDKDFIESPCRHIASFAKKLKESSRQPLAADKLVFDFDFRMDEWRAQALKSAGELEHHHQTMAQKLGSALWEITDCAKLTPVLARMFKTAEEAGKVPRLMQAKEMAAIREHAAHHLANRDTWRQNAEALAREFDQALQALGESFCLKVADGEVREIRADTIGKGLRIQTLASVARTNGESGSMLLVTEEGAARPGVIRIRNLRIYPERDGS
jgi:hypothetical protein